MTYENRTQILLQDLDKQTRLQVDEFVDAYHREVSSQDVTDKMAARSLKNQFAVAKQEFGNNEKAISACLAQLLLEFAVRFLRRYGRPVTCNELTTLLPEVSGRIAGLYLFLDPQVRAPERFGSHVPLSGMTSGSQASLYLVKSPDRTTRVAKVAKLGSPEAIALQHEKEILDLLNERLPSRPDVRFARLIDHGENERVVFLILDHVDGTTLERAIAERRLSVTSVGEICLQLAQTLAAVHNLAILHLDLSPRNVIVSQATSNPVATILDFGTAAEIEFANEPVERPESIGKGTPGYASPEVAEVSSVCVQSDIYSIGAVCLDALAGCVPAEADELESFKHNADSQTRQFLAVLGKATCESPQDRYADAVELANAVRPFALSTRQRKRKRRVAFAGVLAAASLMILMVLFAYHLTHRTVLPPPMPPVETRQLTWLEEVARSRNIELKNVTQEHFNPSLDFMSPKFAQLTNAAFLRVDVDKEIFDLARGVEFRINSGHWRQMALVDGGFLSASLSHDDIKGAKSIDIQVDEHPGEFTGSVVIGPFRYEMEFDANGTQQLDELRRQQQALLDSETLIYFDNMGHWQPGQELLDAANAIKRIHFYPSPTAKNPLVLFPLYPIDFDAADISQMFNNHRTYFDNQRYLRLFVEMRADDSSFSREYTQSMFTGYDLSKASDRNQAVQRILSWSDTPNEVQGKGWVLSSQVDANLLGTLINLQVGSHPDALNNEIAVTATTWGNDDPLREPIPTPIEFAAKLRENIGELLQSNVLYVRVHFVDGSSSSVIQFLEGSSRPVVETSAGKWTPEPSSDAPGKGSNQGFDDESMPIKTHVEAVRERLQGNSRNEIALKALEFFANNGAVTWSISKNLTDKERRGIEAILLGAQPNRFAASFSRSGNAYVQGQTVEWDTAYTSSAYEPFFWQVLFVDGSQSDVVEGYTPQRVEVIDESVPFRLDVNGKTVERTTKRSIPQLLDKVTSPRIWKTGVSSGDVYSYQGDPPIIKLDPRHHLLRDDFSYLSISSERAVLQSSGREIEGVKLIQRVEVISGGASDDQIKAIKSYYRAQCNRFVSTMLVKSGDRWQWDESFVENDALKIGSIYFCTRVASKLPKPSLQVHENEPFKSIVIPSKVKAVFTNDKIPYERRFYLVATFLDNSKSDFILFENSAAPINSTPSIPEFAPSVIPISKTLSEAFVGFDPVRTKTALEMQKNLNSVRPIPKIPKITTD
ncbi:serine/threonine protein kinase [Planctomycetes bacterium TBK1r]|uniref:Serine/threonine-protein kinase StkP n=1 Tax=Stieleria magnilauensis TaxID=2527963 RepID=A0ABX5XHA8_9BACT|nr:Serine/threonine-protein kinase StkP [Planctomycetes bacterium TBK1r]